MKNKLKNEVNIEQVWNIETKDNIHTKRFITFLYFFFLLFFSGMIVLFTIFIFAPGSNIYINDQFNEALLGYVVLGSLFSTILFLIIALSKSKEIVNNFREKITSKNIKIFVIYLSIFFIGAILISVFINLFYAVFNDSDLGSITNANQAAIENQIRSAPFIALLAFVVLGPLMEEIAFRYGIIGSFKNKTLGLFVSAFIFASLHLVASIGTDNFKADLWTFPSYLFSGFIFGLLYIKTDNLVYSYGLHFINNLIAYIVVIISILTAT